MNARTSQRFYLRIPTGMELSNPALVNQISQHTSDTAMHVSGEDYRELSHSLKLQFIQDKWIYRNLPSQYYNVTTFGDSFTNLSQADILEETQFFEFALLDFQTANWTEIIEFVRNNTQIQDVLTDFINKVSEYFGEDSSVSLRIDTDIDTGEPFLLASVQTNLNVEEVLETGTKFARGWWNRATRGLGNTFVFNVEFA